MLFYVNVPICIGLPALLQTGIIEASNPAKAEMVSILLGLTDFFFFFNSVLMYTVISSVTKSIHYLPEENKFVFKQYSSKTLTVEDHKYDPKQLMLHKRKSINPFVGYKSLDEDNKKFATEHLGIWHDR